jgi:hypothetical protein
MARPDPFTQIELRKLHATRGANFWSSRPVIRMDLATGAYDEISSADFDGVVDSLVQSMPGFIEHRCSIGERGGFIMRLRRGTYAPHMIEHIALELQNIIGHDVGYGRTRGGDERGEYTLVFEHLHEGVGLRAAELALDVVRKAFAGQLTSVDFAVDELRAIAREPATAPPDATVLCGITGGVDRTETRDELVRLLGSAAGLEQIVDVPPSQLLEAGLPYASSEIAIIMGAELYDVPERYREPDRARRLVTTLMDALPRGGMVIVPAGARELQDEAKEADCRVAVFTTQPDPSERECRFARLVARLEGERVAIDSVDGTVDGGTVDMKAALAPQVAAALAAFCLKAASEGSARGAAS